MAFRLSKLSAIDDMEMNKVQKKYTEKDFQSPILYCFKQTSHFPFVLHRCSWSKHLKRCPTVGYDGLYVGQQIHR